MGTLYQAFRRLFVTNPCKTSQEIAEENARASPIGFFNRAEGFLLSARALDEARVRHGFREAPIRALYIHSIELYLKALLRQNCFSVDELARKYRHDLKRLAGKAKKYGLVVTDEFKEVLILIRATDALDQAYYPQTGFTQVHELETLSKVCEELHNQVGKLLRKAGLNVRGF